MSTPARPVSPKRGSARPANVQEVSPNLKFDESALSNYLRKEIPGFAEAEKTGPLNVLQFSHGQSNPTYYLEIGTGKSMRQFVLRKKPPGKLLPSAHAIEREYRVLSALRGSMVPVPVTYCLCIDSAVIGTPFYIMQYVAGRIFKNVELPGMNRSDRFAIYGAMNKVLAALHSVDFTSLGLNDFGQTENYVGRQVRRWSSQYEASKTSEIAEMNELTAYLNQNLPTGPDSQLVTLVHGDFRLDNLIFHPRENRIVAVLDWELSTLGHPSTDLAYNCMMYHHPSSFPVMGGLKGSDLQNLGIPDERTYVNGYIMSSKRQGYIQDFPFYCGLSFFRMASIGQGVYKRSLQGNASQQNAQKFGDMIPFLAREGLAVAKSSPAVTWKKSIALQQQQDKMDLTPFQFSEKFWDLRKKLLAFMEECVFPNEATAMAQHAELAKKTGNRFLVPPIMETLKEEAKKRGLWNLFLTKNKDHGHNLGVGLSNLEYAPLCEILGRSPLIAPEVTNCAAPDTGNMEVLANYGTKEQKEKWLVPLMNGEIRSCFGMTEPMVASSDATNIECRIERVSDGYLINGRKWWTSGAMDPRCAVCIVMGKTDPTAPPHRQQSMVLVPMNAPGVRIVRPLHVFGYDDAPHGHAEVEFCNVKVPLTSMLLGEGRGFEIAQGRLGPGRIHHCMRLVGMADRCLEMMTTRVLTRHAFGQALAKKGSILRDLAESRIQIQQCRLLTLQAAALMDEVGNKRAKQIIGMIKVAAPKMALDVMDRAIQAFGAQGVNQDTILAHFWAASRTLRIADGPDEVHLEQIGKLELLKAKL